MPRRVPFPVGVFRLVVGSQFSRQNGELSDSMAGPGFSRGFSPL
jgi:hypothetical protein